MNVRGQKWVLDDVAYVPSLSANLISVSKMSQKGFNVMIDDTEAVISKNGVKKLSVPRRGGLWVLECDYVFITGDAPSSSLTQQQRKNDDSASNTVEAVKNALRHLHAMYGHVGYTTLQHVIQRKSVDGVSQLLTGVTTAQPTQYTQQLLHEQ